MSTTTPNYGLIKPGVNDPTDQDLWGGYLNSDLDTIDTTMKANENLATGSTNAQTADYTVLATDQNKTLLIDATAGVVTINLLPAATAGDGFKVTIKKIDVSANAVNVDGNASETIDGLTVRSLLSQWDCMTIQSNGTNWFRIDFPISKATQAEVVAETANKFADAAFLKYSPGVAKAWGTFDASSGTIGSTAYYNAAVVRNSTGVYTVTIPAMSSTIYPVIASGRRSGSGDEYVVETERTSATTFVIRTFVNNVGTNPIDMLVSFTVFGTLA